MKNETDVVKRGRPLHKYILLTVTSRYWDRLGEEWASPVPEYESAYSSIFSNLKSNHTLIVRT